MPPRRKRPSSSQSQPSHSSQSRPSKRAKLAPPPSSLPLPTDSPLPSLSPAHADPPKRSYNPGTLRRLALPRPRNPRSTLSGSRIGGRSKDPPPLSATEAEAGEEMYVTRTGLGFSGYLKKGVAVFLQRGARKLVVRGMGAAIPLAMGVALAVKEEVGGTLQVRTGSETVTDEITPDCEDDDIIYQTRDKSTVLIEVRVSEVLTIAPPPSRSARGGRHGGGRGGGRGRGRSA